MRADRMKQIYVLYTIYMEARPSTPFGVSGRAILTRNTFQKDKRRNAGNPLGEWKQATRKDRDLLCKRKKVLQMVRSEDRWRESDGSRLCPLIGDEIRSTLHSRTLCHSTRPFHPSLFLFA